MKNETAPSRPIPFNNICSWHVKSGYWSLQPASCPQGTQTQTSQSSYSEEGRSDQRLSSASFSRSLVKNADHPQGTSFLQLLSLPKLKWGRGGRTEGDLDHRRLVQAFVRRLPGDIWDMLILKEIFITYLKFRCLSECPVFLTAESGNSALLLIVAEAVRKHRQSEVCELLL